MQQSRITGQRQHQAARGGFYRQRAFRGFGQQAVLAGTQGGGPEIGGHQ
jgi:hypothetical protein